MYYGVTVLKIKLKMIRFLRDGFKVFTAAFIASVVILIEAPAQIVVPYTIRYQTQQRGNIAYVSNSIISCNGGVGTCVTARAENPSGGVGSKNNNDFTMQYIDIDGVASTFSSSSADLSLLPCSQITWAGLYWGGDARSGSPANYANRNTVKIKIPGSAVYQTLTADTMIDNTVHFLSYHCLKNVTSLLQAGGNGTYTVADVVLRTGTTGLFGGWTIVVVYKNDALGERDLTVFDGLTHVGPGTPVNVNLSGFKTPVLGAVTFEVGHITYEGDRASLGDSLLFNDGVGGLVPISDAGNNPDNIYNSSITNNGVNVNTRNPNYRNTLGYDADIFIPNNTLKNYITNNQSSVTLRQTSSSEFFLTNVVTMAIDVFEPEFRMSKTATDINGGLTLPGDTILYTIFGQNLGNDISLLTTLVDTLPFNVDYVPNSLNITTGPNAGAKTDALLDDQAEYVSSGRYVKFRLGTGANATSGGAISPIVGFNSTTVEFKVVATSECPKLLCSNIISNQAKGIYKGNLSGRNITSLSGPSGVDAFGCSFYGPTKTTITVPPLCSMPPDTAIINCGSNYAFSSLSSVRPGYTYFNSSYVSVTTGSSSGTYYGINYITTGCIDTFIVNLTVNPIFNPPTINNPTCGVDGSIELNGTFGNLDSIAYCSGGTFTSGTFYHINSLSPALTLTPINAGVYTFRVKSNLGCYLDRTRTLVYINCPPLAADDAYSFSPTTYSSDVGSNDDEPDSDPVTYSVLSGPSAGALTFNADGTFTYNSGSFRGTTTFTYLICDDRSPSLCDTGLVTITVISPLPVELTSFYGYKNHQTNMLIWNTASELNNDYFDLLRSTNDAYYEKIATIKGSGTTNIPHKYSYNDNSITKEVKYFYKLKQTDFNGLFTVSKPISIDGENSKAKIELFPNPNKGMFRIKLNCESDGVVSLSVVSQFGSQLYKEEFSCTGRSTIKEIRLQNPPKGMYYLIVNGNGNSMQTKFSVTK